MLVDLEIATEARQEYSTKLKEKKIEIDRLKAKEADLKTKLVAESKEISEAKKALIKEQTEVQKLL